MGVTEIHKTLLRHLYKGRDGKARSLVRKHISFILAGGQQIAMNIGVTHSSGSTSKICAVKLNNSPPIQRAVSSRVTPTAISLMPKDRVCS